MSWRERERERESRHRHWYNLFCCSSQTCLLIGSVFPASLWLWEPFMELIWKWVLEFLASLHIVASRLQLTFFWFSIPPSPISFLFEFLPANQNPFPGSLLIHIYFWTWHLLLSQPWLGEIPPSFNFPFVSPL